MNNSTYKQKVTEGLEEPNSLVVGHLMEQLVLKGVCRPTYVPKLWLDAHLVKNL